MKIAVIGTRGFPFIQGGVEKHCESLYPLFGGSYQFIVFRRRSYVKDSCGYSHITFKDLPSTRIKGFETVFHSFLSVCVSLWLHPDIAHFHNIGPAMFSPILRLAGIKVVLTYHSPNYEHRKWGWAGRFVLRVSEKIALATAHKIIFVNKFQMAKYSDKVQRKSYFIPNGISSPVYSTDRNYLNKIDVEPYKYILAVGRITPEKGFDYLIKAFVDLDSDEYKLVIAGGVETEGRYLNDLKSMSLHNNIIFTGYVHGENLHQLYSYARLYVLSSYNEGFPLVLLEAMSYGLPVLVSDISATHLVKLPVECYFSVGNRVELTHKLGSILVEKMDKEHVSYSLDSFSWENIVNRVSEICNDLG